MILGYILFWNKILIKRTMDLLKQSPVIFVGLFMSIAAFIVGRQNITIELNIKTAIILLVIFAILSIIASLRNYHIMPVLIAHSKSNLSNKDIKILFFIKRSFINNILLIFFSIIILTPFIKTDYYAIMPVIMGSIASLALSFFIMYLKDEYASKKIYKVTGRKSKISPVIKGAFHDYVTPDFAAVLIFCYAVFGAVIFDMGEMDNPLLVLPVLTAILSVGMMSVNESIQHINWRFLSIIYPQNIFSHVKRTALFMVCVLGLLLMIFILIALQMGILALVKCLYNVIVLLLFLVYNAFTRSNMIVKVIRSLFFVVLVIWAGTLHPAFLILPIIPLVVIVLWAKNDFGEWYLQ